MSSYTGTYTASGVVTDESGSAVTFGADVSQDSVYLSAQVRPSHAFARVMLALGRVVRMKETAAPKDHSAYRAWVWG